MTYDTARYGSSYDYRVDNRLAKDQGARWDELRNECPVRLNDTATSRRVWLLMGYEDVRSAFQDWETFSSRSLEAWESDEMIASKKPWIPVEIDPPLHTEYRSLVSPFFTPRAITDLAAGIREQCAALIDELAGRGRIEFIADVGKVFPTRVFMNIMGLPVEKSDEMLAWIDTLMHTSPTEDPDYKIRYGVRTEIFGFLGDLLAQRRRQPKDDILTAIVSTELPSGRLLSGEEALSMTFLLYMAGLDTVAAALAYIFRYLAERPDVRRKLISQDVSARDVAEELLRTHSVINTGRVVMKDVEFAGCPMRQGDRVILSTAAANRDPAEFGDNAAEIKIGRRPNRHIGFGAGVHRCLGSHLARAELEIMIDEWHKRIPDYRIPAAETVVDLPGSVSALASLPLEWELR